MLKKTITYTNLFTKEKMSEDHWFHISKVNLLEMEMANHKEVCVSPEGETLTGWRAKLQKLVDAEDGKAVMAAIREFIVLSYGVRRGNDFDNHPDTVEAFTRTEAFSQLHFDLCTNPEVASVFINGIFPDDMEQIAEEIQARVEKAKSVTEKPNLVTTSEPMTIAKGPVAQLLSQKEITEMDSDELKSGLATGKYRLS